MTSSTLEKKFLPDEKLKEVLIEHIRNGMSAFDDHDTLEINTLNSMLRNYDNRKISKSELLDFYNLSEMYE